jgi:hypothetical protein
VLPSPSPSPQVIVTLAASIGAGNRRAVIAGVKEIERIAWTVQPFKGQGGRWQKGPMLGPGPVPGYIYDEERKPPPRFKWDRHGRRHPAAAMAEAEAEGGGGLVALTMARLRALAEAKGRHQLDLRKPFERFDRDGSRSLDRDEMAAALRALGLDLRDQVWVTSAGRRPPLPSPAPISQCVCGCVRRACCALEKRAGVLHSHGNVDFSCPSPSLSPPPPPARDFFGATPAFNLITRSRPPA